LAGRRAENEKYVIDSLASQTDLAATILNQVHLPHRHSAWSNDIFRKDRHAFAYFAFNNGLGWINRTDFWCGTISEEISLKEKEHCRSRRKALGKRICRLL
jgi:phosphoglycerol transferase MdoB-like AlkP superfamily enzyme